MQLKAEVDNLPQVNAFVDSLLAQQEISSQKRFQLDLAVEEIFVNIASYAYGAETGDVTIEGFWQPESSRLELTFIDQGLPYDPLKRQDPDITLRLEERQGGGLGIFLAKKNVDSMQYEYRDGCNRLMISKAMR
ncbi:Anti-sigma regulatory factor (Ser/Thr protein kinase) [Selenomonas sp. GACV-9]|uniref:ATP-binding protein n=1 Tax=Selenomonas sp. GACV-9 TaxID=3158782 RepID=UPI0008E94EF8|nr:Anti-sigma regulatory factor (Ser/Thr protein kinase) [Selenomonas ruminantium]